MQPLFTLLWNLPGNSLMLKYVLYLKIMEKLTFIKW